jgi:hypothetical protein
LVLWWGNQCGSSSWPFEGANLVVLTCCEGKFLFVDVEGLRCWLRLSSCWIFLSPFMSFWMCLWRCVYPFSCCRSFWDVPSVVCDRFSPFFFRSKN